MAETVHFGGSEKHLGGIYFFFVECDKATAKTLGIAGVSLYRIYKASGLIERLIDGIVFRGLGGARDDQAITAIRRGSLLVQLKCFTDERFMEVWKDYISGELKKRLQKEFSAGEIEVEELTIHIKNLKEVKETRTQIEVRKGMETRPSTEQTPNPGRRISPRIIVQGGTYTKNDDREEDFLRGVKDAAWGGYDFLKDGKTAVDAVQEAVRIMEDNEHFNAGAGSVLNHKGDVECDAMIMDGKTMKTGAVMAVRNFRNPVKLSKEVMDKTHHCALSTYGALAFAKEINFETCDKKELIIGPEFHDVLESTYTAVPAREKPKSRNSGVVTAVAMDASGHLACAISTGGITGKREGRIGDAPLVGCGGYANEFGAAASCGHGEALMKMTLARDVVFNIETGLDAQKSTEKSVKRMQDRVEGVGGVIAIDKDGNFGKAFNTEVMIWASIEHDELNYGMEPGDCFEELV